MKKPQIIAVLAALVSVAGLYFLGPTVNPERVGKPAAPAAAVSGAPDIEKLESTLEGRLSEARRQYLNGLKTSVKQGVGRQQQSEGYARLAAFWKDTVANALLHYNYSALGAQLDNTEKSLTFAGHSILAYLPYAHNQQEQVWLAEKGKQLFEKALSMNAANDSSTIGLGGCIMYGASSSGSPMEGIQRVRAIADRDSANLFAQYMLGIGGMLSGQYDRAAQRFSRVAMAEPNNLEVWFKLAEAYERSGQNEKAIATYQKISSRISIPEMKLEIEKRIQQLKADKAASP